MKFYIESLHLWLKSGQERTVSFKPNKVNVITGRSHTGKTAILDIFDYCMFGSTHRISESVINENVSWYGLKMHINGKEYALARRAPNGTTVSGDYFLSSLGRYPQDGPSANISESALKKQLSADFGIDQDVRIPFGGRTVKAGSRISLRYFLLFNTLSQNIITHSTQFFDKQDEARYQEALPRIFDIAVGIDTVEHILMRERRTELERQLAKLERLIAKADDKREEFNSDLTETLSRARAFGLVGDEPPGVEPLTLLKRVVEDAQGVSDRYVSVEFGEISAEMFRIRRQIRGLQKFEIEYNKHKETLKDAADSLRPIEQIKRKYEELVRTSVFGEIVDSLSEGLAQIKKSTVGRTPLDGNVTEIVKDLHQHLSFLQARIQSFPKEVESFATDAQKFIFIGETKAKLDMYGDPKSDDVAARKRLMDSLEAQINDLKLPAIEEKRQLFSQALDETIQEYIDLTKDALGNYGSYRSAFDYGEKRLHLRKPRTTSTENVGSSSNHMFLHLFLFLGLHDQIMRSGGEHVAPFLIIDQFSRPYWGDDGDEDLSDGDIDESDVAKVKLALKLLDKFISTVNEIGHEFQMIVFEHINPRYWDGMDNVHLVEIFRNGNALIPLSTLRKS